MARAPPSVWDPDIVVGTAPGADTGTAGASGSWRPPWDASGVPRVTARSYARCADVPASTRTGVIAIVAASTARVASCDGVIEATTGFRVGATVPVTGAIRPAVERKTTQVTGRVTV